MVLSGQVVVARGSGQDECRRGIWVVDGPTGVRSLSVGKLESTYGPPVLVGVCVFRVDSESLQSVERISTSRLCYDSVRDPERGHRVRRGRRMWSTSAASSGP